MFIYPGVFDILMGRKPHKPKLKSRTLRYTKDGKCPVNIPIEIPRFLGWKDGDEILVRLMGDGSIRIFNLYGSTAIKKRVKFIGEPRTIKVEKKMKNYKRTIKEFIKEEDLKKWMQNKDRTEYIIYD